MLDRRSVNWCGETESFFKTAVRYLHLLIRHASGTRAILPAAGDVQSVVLNFDLDLLGADAREFDLDDPAVRSLIDIGRRIPKLSAADILCCAGKLKKSVSGFGHLSVVSGR